jgi:hypothetical protein
MLINQYYTDVLTPLLYDMLIQSKYKIVLFDSPFLTSCSFARAITKEQIDNYSFINGQLRFILENTK